MSHGSELKFIRERADVPPEIADALNSFAPENDLAEPSAPMRASRGRAWLAVTVLALGGAGWGAYEYESSHPIDLDGITAPASHLESPPSTAKTPDATPPGEQARPNNPTPTDPLLASTESIGTPNQDRKAVQEAARPQSTGTSGSLAGPVKNVSGEWRLDILTETSDSSLEGVKLHYEMTLKQEGNRVAGIGTKVNEAGSVAETPVTLTGTIAGDRLTLNFVERVTQDDARGKFVLMFNDAGTLLRGRFSSSAAPSSGHVEARRVQLP